jgi:uncharacterized membrane protein
MVEVETQVKGEEFDVDEWLKEGRQGLRRMLRSKRRHILPSEFRAHTRAARKEMLLAVRSLLDTAINRLEGEPKPARQAAKIEIE